jgi:diaminopimelate epimerase
MNDMTSTSPPGAPRSGLAFLKMHGLGNDYVFVDAFEQEVPEPGQLALRVSDRHFGVGGDGLVLILPSEIAEARMRIFNSDGSEAQICGNALRCVARYLMERRLGRMEPLRIETLAGVHEARPIQRAGALEGIQIAMGRPEFRAPAVPVATPDPEFVLRAIPEITPEPRWTAVSVGNPHLVTFLEHASGELVRRWGPRLERHPLFPERINVEIASLEAADRLRVHVWERGAGATLACGSGATATFAVARRLKLVPPRATIVLPGGELVIEETPGGELLMTGPASYVFEGVLDLAFPA